MSKGVTEMGFMSKYVCFSLRLMYKPTTFYDMQIISPCFAFFAIFWLERHENNIIYSINHELIPILTISI